MAQPTFVVIEHPSGFAERTSAEEIRLKYDMSLDEYRYFVATEPDGAAARNARRKRRQNAVLDKTAERVKIPENAILANYEYVETASQEKHVVERASLGSDVSSFRARRHVVPTPFGYELTEEERREIFIPKGPYRPGFASRGGPAAAYNYVPAPSPVKKHTERTVKPGCDATFAERLIASTPAKGSAVARREHWERELLGAYLALYEESWAMWPKLIPWLAAPRITDAASVYGYEARWDWQSRVDFLEELDLDWTLDELKLLIDWYPEYQENHSEQNIFAGKKPFAEVQAIARALRLPSKRELRALVKHAQSLAKLR